MSTSESIANGSLYVVTQASLRVYGLLPNLLATGGNRQTATVFTALPLPLQVNAATGYSGGAIYGATVTFSDGGQGGSFSASSAAPMILPYVKWDYKSFPTMQKNGRDWR